MDQKTTKLVNQFAARVNKLYRPSKIILFGSRARGDHLNNSDFDFIIVSENFKGKPFIFRASNFYNLWDSPLDMEPLCYTPEEFERKKKERGIVAQAAKEGIEIKT